MTVCCYSFHVSHFFLQVNLACKLVVSITSVHRVTTTAMRMKTEPSVV